MGVVAVVVYPALIQRELHRSGRPRVRAWHIVGSSAVLALLLPFSFVPASTALHACRATYAKAPRIQSRSPDLEPAAAQGVRARGRFPCFAMAFLHQRDGGVSARM